MQPEIPRVPTGPPLLFQLTSTANGTFPDLIAQLGKLTKESFDLDGMLEAAGDLKYMREIRRLLDKQFDDPDDEFVRYFFSQPAPTGTSCNQPVISSRDWSPRHCAK